MIRFIVVRALIPFVFLVTACDSERADGLEDSEVTNFTFEDFERTSSVALKVVNEVPAFLNATRMKLIDDRLFIRDSGDLDNLYKVYKTETFEQEVFFGKIGDGPNEFVGPYTVYVQNDTLFIQDLTGGKVKLYRYSELIENKRMVHLGELPFGLEQGQTIYDFALYDGNYVTLTSNSKRIKVLDQNLELQAQFGEYPDIPLDYSLSEEEMIYKNLLNYADASWGMSSIFNDRVVLKYSYLQLIEVFDLKEKKLLLKIVGPNPQYFPPEIKYYPKSDMYFPVKETSFSSYIRLQTAKVGFFLLYSGQPLTSMPTGTGKTIMFFDWEGKPKSLYHLNKEIVAFQVDLKREKLYCLLSEEFDNRLAVTKLDL